MAVDVEIDVEVLKCEIKKTYARVSAEPEQEFIFPTGRAWALDLGYPPDLLARVPDGAAESFAGVANPFTLGGLAPGERVLDLGSGAGMDSLVATQMVGAPGLGDGHRHDPRDARKSPLGGLGDGRLKRRVRRGRSRVTSLRGRYLRVVISNGVIDLIPDKDTVFSEINRVLGPGGRIQIADVTIQNPVSEEGRRNIDLWTG